LTVVLRVIGSFVLVMTIRCSSCTLSLEPSAHPSFFFFDGPATTDIYTLSLHDALPISSITSSPSGTRFESPRGICTCLPWPHVRSEEHTSELQSRGQLVCRLLLEKKKPHTSLLHLAARRVPCADVLCQPPRNRQRQCTR